MDAALTLAALLLLAPQDERSEPQPSIYPDMPAGTPPVLPVEGASASTPEESIAKLKRIAPGAENYLAARYDLCLLLHQQ